MSPLTVHTCADYFAEDYSEGPAQETYRALKFVKAIKGETFRGWADVPVPIGGQRRRLEPANAADAIPWFAEMEVAEGVLDTVEPCLLVPMPSSSSTSAYMVWQSRPWAIALAIARQRDGFSPEAVLWWDQPMASAHKQGGKRDPSQLLPHLVSGRLGNGEQVVLVDDVLTSGGHMQAAEARLRGAGFNVLFGICPGRTVHAETPSPFEWREHRYERVDP